MFLNFKHFLGAVFLTFFIIVNVNASAIPYMTHGPNVDMEKAVIELRVKANTGNAEAQFDLALHYSSGEGIDRDLQLTFVWLKKAADQNLAQAQLYIAEYYAQGAGGEQNIALAFSYLEKAANQGLIDAQLGLADCYVSSNKYKNELVGGQNFEAARYWYQRALDGGSIEAAYDLAMLYKSGKGGPKDDAKAISLLTDAAMNGDQRSIDAIELSNDSDKLIFSTALLDQANDFYYMKSNSERSLSSYLTSIDMGNILAKAQLAKMMYLGAGVTQDKATAIALFAEVNQPLESFAQSGDPFAQYLWGYYYGAGFNDSASPSEAVYWYRKAAEQGYAPAQNNLGHSLSNGEGVEQSDVKALYWFTKAAEQNHVIAQANLAGFYKNGDVITQDYDQALSWYLKAAQLGYAPAAKKIGIMCENGEGCIDQAKWYAIYEKKIEYRNMDLDVDLGVALIWYHTAVKLGEISAQEQIDTLMEKYPSCQISDYNLGVRMLENIETITDNVEMFIEYGCEDESLNYAEYIEDGTHELLVDFAKRYWMNYSDMCPASKEFAKIARSSLNGTKQLANELSLKARECSETY